jgi:long-chain acyl-CoA synthetase
MGLADSGRPTTERLYAVVVPNMDLIRERQIANVGDLLRFELEGLSHLLPEDQRTRGYEIWFDPLPRTTPEHIDRDEVERRVRERQRMAQSPLSDADRAWLDDPDLAAAVQIIQAHAKGDVRIRPDANLELDLGFDSLQRVELLTQIEQQFDIKLSQAATCEIYTLRQLIDAVRSAAAARERGDSRAAKVDQTWATLLRELPELNWLLRKRTFDAPVWWLLLRIVRMIFVRVRVNGVDQLPRSGPYIITPNHQSYIDPFVLCSVLPYRALKDVFLVGAPEYFETPFTRWVARTTNLVPVDPDSNLVPAMQACAFGLTHGKILVLFPEGERSIDGTVKKFKKGAPILAQHLGVPVVPVALKGIYEVWPRHRGINWRLVAPWSGHRVSIEFGEPMRFPAAANYHQSATQLRSRVSEMWEALST